MGVRTSRGRALRPTAGSPTWRARRFFGSSALALLLGAGFAGAAAAAPAAAPAASSWAASLGSARPGPAASVRTRSARIDVDGDGRLDALTVSWRTSGDPVPVTLSVRTARGARSQLVVPTSGVVLQGALPWMGSAPVDGVRGDEIVLMEAFGDVPHLGIFTWRSGRLSRLQPPDRADDGAANWMISPGYPGLGYVGYSFGASGGARTVTWWRLGTRTRSGRWFGTGVTYRWTSTGWRPASRTTASLTDSQAMARVDLGGLALRS